MRNENTALAITLKVTDKEALVAWNHLITTASKLTLSVERQPVRRVTKRAAVNVRNALSALPLDYGTIEVDGKERLTAHDSEAWGERDPEHCPLSVLELFASLCTLQTTLVLGQEPDQNAHLSEITDSIGDLICSAETLRAYFGKQYVSSDSMLTSRMYSNPPDDPTFVMEVASLCLEASQCDPLAVESVWFTGSAKTRHENHMALQETLKAFVGLEYGSKGLRSITELVEEFKKLKGKGLASRMNTVFDLASTLCDMSANYSKLDIATPRGIRMYGSYLHALAYQWANFRDKHLDHDKCDGTCCKHALKDSEDLGPQRVVLRSPGATAWQVRSDAELPEFLAKAKEEGRINDVGPGRVFVEIKTEVGPTHVPEGAYVIRTDQGLVVGMLPEDFAEVWKPEEA